MIKNNLAITVLIIIASVGISIFLWSVGVYFFFLPIIFLPFLRLVKFKPRGLKTKVCPVCELPSDGNYCSRYGTKLV